MRRAPRVVPPREGAARATQQDEIGEPAATFNHTANGQRPGRDLRPPRKKEQSRLPLLDYVSTGAHDVATKER